ncbi:MAG: FAD-dependent oxidoreductase [bacterium]
MKIQLTIDGEKIITEKKTTVLEAALANNIYIPNLCYHPDLPPLSTCRLCLVEVEGMRGFPTSCSLEADDGMVVKSNTKKINNMRKKIVWLMLSELSEGIPEGSQLKKVIEYIGVDEVLAEFVPESKNLPIISDEPLFERDMNKCILCGRCVVMCQEIRGVGTLGFKERGYESIVGTSFDDSFTDANCKFCGACVEVCPSGALREKKEYDPEEKEKTLVPCRNTCPAGIDIPRYIQLAAQGRYQDSLEVVRETVPFPLILGLVCDHPCEEVCRRDELGGSIAIRDIKRFVAERDNGRWKEKLKVYQDTGKKVAVVGGGPAGLTTAWFLRLKGHSVTVFEALKNAGGMMFSGIPRYRLPLEVLNNEIKEIENIGVEIKTNTKIEDLDPLFDQGYNAVFLGLGGPLGKSMKIPGDDDPRVTDGIKVLKGVAYGHDMELFGKIAVVGGGNVAMDVARTSLRVGADNVHILYRRAREQAPADSEEIEEAINEGVIFNFLVNPIKIIPGKDHLQIICIKMKLGEPDSSGRRRPIPVEGSEFDIKADKLVVAIGQDHVVPEKFKVDIDKWGSIPVDEYTMETSRKGVFAGGDIVTGPASVIKAIAAGRKAASSIDSFFEGDGIIDRVFVRPEEGDPYLGYDENFPKQKKAKRKTLPVEQRLDSFSQVDQCFTEEQLKNEANRCLKCQLRLKISKAPLPEDFKKQG